MTRPLLPFVVFLTLLGAVSVFGQATHTTPRTGAAAFDQFGAVVASNGFDYLAGWTTVMNNVDVGVFVARVNADGSLAASIGTSLDPTAAAARGLSICPSRDGYFASWISEKGLNTAVLDSYGRVEHQGEIAESPQPLARTLVAWNGAVHLVIRGFDGPFTGALFDNDGEVIVPNIPIGDSHGDQTMKVALTSDGSGFLILATKRVSDRDDVYGRRVSSSGAESDWFLVRSVTNQVQGLSVTWDGSHDLIVWGDHSVSGPPVSAWTRTRSDRHAS